MRLGMYSLGSTSRHKLRVLILRLPVHLQFRPISHYVGVVITVSIRVGIFHDCSAHYHISACPSPGSGWVWAKLVA